MCSMRSLFLGMSLLALVVPAAYAQRSGGPTDAAVSEWVEPGRYLVFFELERLLPWNWQAEQLGAAVNA